MPVAQVVIEELIRERWFLALAVLVPLFVVLLVVRRYRRRRGRQDELVGAEAFVDLGRFGTLRVPDSWPRLELYHLPVRWVFLVLAPLGRGGVMPRQEEAAGLVDQLVPGLGSVFTAQQPDVEIWPAQLSVAGFAHTFFAATQLEDQGRGSPWSAVAGRFEAGGRKYLAGLIVHGGDPNNLGQFVVQNDHQWLDVVRVRM